MATKNIVPRGNGEGGLGTATKGWGGAFLTSIAASSTSAGAKLQLITNDGAVMADTHRLGIIEFLGAEDTSGTVSLGASIEAVADETFTASENASALVFKTTSGTTVSEVLRLDKSKLATFAGDVSIAGNLDVTGTFDLSDSNFTNAGDIKLDSITGDGDADTAIIFSGSNVITFKANNANQLTITDGAVSPVTDSDIDLGTTSLYYKNAYIDGLNLGNEAASNLVFTPSEDDTVTFAAGTNGTLTITTVDTAGTAANVGFVVDGTFDINAAGAVAIDGVGVAVGSSGAASLITSGAASDIVVTTVHTAGMAFQLNANTNAASEVEINAGILDINAAGVLTIDSGTSISIGATADKPVIIDSTTFALDAASTIIVDGTGVSIDGTLDSNLTVTGSDKDLTLSVVGGGTQKLILSSAGTGANAISIDASAGSVLLAPSLVDGQTLKLGKNGAVEAIFSPHGTAGSEKFSLINTAGTATDAIKITAAAGSIDINSGDNITIDAADNIGITTDLLTITGPTSQIGNFTTGANDTGVDVRFFSATINEGVLYDASQDELGLLLTTKLKFHDIGGGEEIFASANGHLEINAGTTLDITAPTVDVNGAMDVSGEITATGFTGTLDGVLGSGAAAAATVTTLNTSGNVVVAATGATITIQDTADSASGGTLAIQNTDTGVNNHEGGRLYFYADDSSNNVIEAGLITSIFTNVSPTAKNTSLRFSNYASNSQRHNLTLSSTGIQVLDSGTIGCASDVNLLTLTDQVLTVAGNVVSSGRLFVTAADGVSDGEFVASIINQEATDTRSFGLTINAGSNASDIALNVTDHDAANVLLRVTGDGNTAFGGNIKIPDAGTIGSASDIDALKIEADGVVISTKGIEFEGNALAAGQSGISSSGDGNEIRIYTNGNQAFTFGASGAGGDLVIENGDIAFSTAGKGICLGNTSNTDANTLDDYEEGVWDAAMSAGTGTITLLQTGTPGVDQCFYTKIGRVVNISGFFSVASVSSPSGRLKITGLPFAQISDGVPVGVAYITASNSYTGFGVMIGDQSSGVFIDRNAVNGADPSTDLAGAMKANTEVYFNLTYTTNA
jgi:hypothetical protein